MSEQPTPTVTNDQLVSELWARDVRFILGKKPNHPPTLPPFDLIVALAENPETRLQLSLIPLFLCHPEFSQYAVEVSIVLDPATRLLLECFYTAAVWIERKYLSQNNLPDLFSSKLGLSPSDDPAINLSALSLRQKELSGLPINWLATYQHAADVWFKDLEFHKAENG